MTGRTIVVGDIHGCYDELGELLARVDLRAQDRVVAVGDLIVKGEQSRAVLDLFMSDPRFSSIGGSSRLCSLAPSVAAIRPTSVWPLFWAMSGTGHRLPPMSQEGRSGIDVRADLHLAAQADGRAP